MQVRKGIVAFALIAAAAVWLTAATYGAGPRNATIGVTVMVALSAAFIFAVVAFGFVGIVIHEFGHAIAAVALTPGRSLIEVGAPPRPFRFSIGRIDLNLGRGRGAAHCDCLGAVRSRHRVIAIVAAGPLASALFGGLLLLASTRLRATGHPDVANLVLSGALLQLWGVVTNLKPVVFERADDDGVPRLRPNDGEVIRRTARGIPHDRGPRRAPFDRRAEIAIGVALRLAQRETAESVTTEHVLRAVAATDATSRELLARHSYRTTDTVPDVQPDPPPPPAAEFAAFVDRAFAQRSLSGHADATAEHLLLAIIREPACAAYAALTAAGADPAGLRADLITALA